MRWANADYDDARRLPRSSRQVPLAKQPNGSRELRWIVPQHPAHCW